MQVWNEEIALIAQRFADQCMDDCPNNYPICHEHELLSGTPTGLEKLRNKLDGTSVSIEHNTQHRVCGK